ncbi:MAG: hydroxymethylbilane synthase [Phycisphaerae bacterium]
MRTLRIGTRRSDLAMVQARSVGETLQAAMPEVAVEYVPLVSQGDRRRGPLAEAGGKGLFTTDLEEALRVGSIDLAVHSAKDMPAEMADDLCIAAVPPRADARDVLVTREGLLLQELRKGAIVGTGSPRRAALLRSARPDLQVAPIRGNVETRFARAAGNDADLDAVVLAAAGLERLGWMDTRAECVCPLPVEEFPPAGGQGTLVVQATQDSRWRGEVASGLDHGPSREALLAERDVLRRLGASCTSCVSVYVFSVKAQWCLRAMVARPDGQDMLRQFVTSDSADGAALLAVSRLIRAGALERMEGID